MQRDDIDNQINIGKGKSTKLFLKKFMTIVGVTSFTTWFY